MSKNLWKPATMIETLWQNKWFRAFGIGICLTLAYSPVHFFPLLWIGLALLINEVRNSRDIRDAMANVYRPVVIWNLGTTYWLMMATLPGGLAAVFANAVVLTVPLGLAYPFLTSKKPFWQIAGSASVWIIFEWIHTRWELAWPWLQLGNGLAGWPVLYQWIEFTGVFGLSFWIFTTAAMLPFPANPLQKPNWKPFLITLVLPILISVCMLFVAIPQPTEKVPVTVVQPNFDSYLPQAGYDDPTIPRDAIVALTDSVRHSGSKLVIWPENAIYEDIYDRYPRQVDAILNQAAASRGYTLLTGATHIRIFNTADAPPLARKFQNGVPFKAYNSAFAFSGTDSLPYYHKRHLVPIVERIPYLGFLNAIDIFGIDFPQMNSYHRGEISVNFDTPYGPVPALVCYDSVFPNWVRSTVRDGAVFVAVITNDGWWGNTSGHWQHYDYARLRAVETRRAIVRSANNGISGIIDASGSTIRRTKYWERTGFTDDVPLYDRKTLYTLWGDWLVVLCAGLSVAGFIAIRKSGTTIY